MERNVQEARRDVLLARLRDFVLDNGFARVCIDDMAGWLRCSKATLYGIGAGKIPLVTAVLGEFFSEVAALAEQRAAHIADPAARISAYLTAIGVETGRMSAACYADMASHAMTGEVYDRHTEAMARQLRGQIDEGIQVGAFRPAHAGFIAEAAALITDANSHGGLPDRAGLTAADAQAQLGNLMAATLTHTAYQRPARPAMIAR
jgi:hypothetical protein